MPVTIEIISSNISNSFTFDKLNDAAGLLENLSLKRSIILLPPTFSLYTNSSKSNLWFTTGSSSIGLKDEITGSVHLVGAHSLSDASSLTAQMALTFLLLVALLHYSLFNGQS